MRIHREESPKLVEAGESPRGSANRFPSRAVSTPFAMLSDLERAPRFHRTHRFGTFLLGEAPPFTSLYEESGDVVHFDGEGRWQRATLSDATYLRGFDGAVLHRFGGPSKQDVRVPSPTSIHDRIVAFVERARPSAPVPLSSWSTEALLAESSRFLTAYRPVGIVPPDRYRSVVIQATQGCAYNGCLFCSLYKGQRHRAVPHDELRAHVQRARAFLGSNLTGRRGLFLGEANALALPQPHLLTALDVLHEELPTLATDVASFLDAFDVHKSTAELAALRARGLSRVFLGAESGDDATLALLQKPATVAGLRGAVDALKAANVSVGVIFLAGLGPTHVDASAALVRSLPLDERDVVYVSPLIVEPGGRLAHALERRGIATLDAAAEATTLHDALRGRAKVARYDVRRWIYT